MMTAAHAATLAVNLLDSRSLISTFGTLGIAVVLFAETGLLVGLFLPGDSLLFTAGVLCATTSTSAVHLQLGWVLVAAAAGALLGAQTGYLIGRAAGPQLLTRPNRPRLGEATRRTREFLDRYGVGKAIVLARFVPLVRTAINPLAGAVQLPPGPFTLWQVIGGVFWTVGVTLAGWQLGTHVANVDHYLLPIIAVIIAVSLIPVAREVQRSRRRGTLDTADSASGRTD